MTYREAINSVLQRLRESTIDNDWSGKLNDSKTVTDYQKLIGELVNDSKRSVESYHGWNALRQTFNVKTQAGLMQYTLGDDDEGSGTSFTVLDVINQTTGTVLEQVTNDWLNKQVFPTSNQSSGEPKYYAFNGVSKAGTDREPDFNIDLYPIPDKINIISVNIVGGSADLTKADDYLIIPSPPVVLGAWARAVAERGEDGGTISSAIAGEARDSLNIAVQLDAGNMEYERDWYVI